MNYSKLEKEVDVFTIEQNVKERGGSEERQRFAISLSSLLASKGIGQKQLAKQIGMTEASISEYCTGKKDPKLTTIVRMAAALGVDCNRLLTGVDAEYKEIGDTTGLSQKAINALHDISSCPAYMRLSRIEVLNHLLESDGISTILEEIAVGIDCRFIGETLDSECVSKGQPLNREPIFVYGNFESLGGILSTDRVIVHRSEYGNFLLSKAIRSISKCFEEIYRDELQMTNAFKFGNDAEIPEDIRNRIIEEMDKERGRDNG